MIGELKTIKIGFIGAGNLLLTPCQGQLPKYIYIKLQSDFCGWISNIFFFFLINLSFINAFIIL